MTGWMTRCAIWVLAWALLALALGAAAPPTSAAAVPVAPAGWPLARGLAIIRSFDPPAERWLAGHRGVDLAAEVDDPVLATGAGTVAFAGSVAGRDVLVVSHGALRTTYEPVTAVVAVGTRVAVGTVVGRLARGSHCPGRPCLHWGLRDGERYLDPLGAAEHEADVRLLGADERAAARRRAAERAAATAAEALRSATTLRAAAVAGSPGTHGFLRPVPGVITSPYGPRFHPVLRVTKLHDGTDFGAPCGTPIRAPHAGRVISAGFHPAYGQRLLLSHGTIAGRTVTTGYNHATGYLVGAGERVERGQLLGYVGSTGLSTGCHLHLMLWLGGQVVDPMTWF